MSIQREWRITHQRRRIGKSYWLQYGFFGAREDWRYGALKKHWVTEYEEDYPTLEKARAALQVRKEQQNDCRTIKA